jgi:hypothetical protein
MLSTLSDDVKDTKKFYPILIALYGAETWTLREVGQIYMESSGMWRWRRMEKIS